jgi:hypothetical protein
MVDCSCDWPSTCVPHPRHPRVQVFCNGDIDGTKMISVEYSGPVADLIDAGVVTAEMLAGNQPGRPRIDADGHHFRIARTVRQRGERYCRIRFYKPAAMALSMPGVREAISAYVYADEWRDRRMKGQLDGGDRAVRTVASILSRFAR